MLTVRGGDHTHIYIYIYIHATLGGFRYVFFVLFHINSELVKCVDIFLGLHSSKLS